MAGLLRNVTNGIWHAFNALQQEEPGAVNKSKLKVLTANIASLFDLYGVEKGLEHFRSSYRLNFLHFRYYLLQEVFSTLSNTTTLADIRNFESKIEEICWLVCRKKYLDSYENVIAETYLYKLFRIFCMLSDFISNNESNQCQVLMHSSEAAQIIQQLITGMGLDFEADKQYNDLICNPRYLPFEEFLQSIELGEYKNLSEFALNEAIEEIYQTYINDVIKKGYLLRRGYLLPSLKEYWFVLQPCELNYYKNQSQKELCGTIILDPNCMVRPSSKSTAKTDKVLKFTLSAGDRNFELGTQDHRSRMQWIAALQLAITYSMGKEGFQRDIVSRRRNKREIEKNLKIQEEIVKNRHLQEAETAKTQLEQEKLARAAAESQARELEIVAREDSRRVAELEDIKMTLENLLSEESQAKRDEEIVRALQARVLSEEWEKREELEQLQEEQRNLLEQEREKRLQFEITQKEREQYLKDAEVKLKELEEERQRLDLELKQARFKILHSEETKELLEARIQDIAPPKDGDRVRRALSFMHSNRERPIHIDIKSIIRERANILPNSDNYLWLEKLVLGQITTVKERISDLSTAEDIAEALGNNSIRSAIVYCRKKAETEQACAALIRRKVTETAFFHSLIPAATKIKNHEDFMSDTIKVLFASIAYGVGVDKANIDTVIHARLAFSIEHFHQESGRAGRDGTRAKSIAYYTSGDGLASEGLIRAAKLHAVEPAILEEQLVGCRLFQNYCEERVVCLRKLILNHFNEYADSWEFDEENGM